MLGLVRGGGTRYVRRTFIVDHIFGEENRSRTQKVLESTKIPKRLAKLPVQSAILIPLCRQNGIPCLLFTKRANTLKSHRGEVCFPGGRRDKNESFEETAFREAEEEIGLIRSDSMQVWGYTPGIPDRTLKYLVKGVICDIGDLSDFEFRLNASEVESVFAVSVEELVSASRTTKFRSSKLPAFEPSPADYRISAYDTNPRIWGLTAIYTNYVLSVLTNGAEAFIAGRSGIRIRK